MSCRIEFQGREMKDEDGFKVATTRFYVGQGRSAIPSFRACPGFFLDFGRLYDRLVPG